MADTRWGKVSKADRVIVDQGLFKMLIEYIEKIKDPKCLKDKSMKMMKLEKQ